MCLFSIYNRFKYKNWIKYSPGTRQKFLEKIEEKQSKKLNREKLPVVIVSDKNWKSYGMFEVNSSGKKTLYLSINLIDDPNLRFHALETIFHEGRHAYQYEQITKKHISWFNFKARRWKDNYAGYITSKEDRTIYSLQPVERDAQKYAIDHMEEFSFKFRNEADYQETMNQMLYRYNTTIQNAKKQYGLFYKSKMYKKIKDKNEQN